MALLGSKLHTVGDTIEWTANYEGWLKNAANIESVNVTSSSVSCTIPNPVKIDGPKVTFFLVGGQLNEQLMVTLTMTDNFGNIKHDTIAFTVVAA